MTHSAVRRNALDSEINKYARLISHLERNNKEATMRGTMRRTSIVSNSACGILPLSLTRGLLAHSPRPSRREREKEKKKETRALNYPAA